MRGDTIYNFICDTHLTMLPENPHLHMHAADLHDAYPVQEMKIVVSYVAYIVLFDLADRLFAPTETFAAQAEIAVAQAEIVAD